MIWFVDIGSAATRRQLRPGVFPPSGDRWDLARGSETVPVMDLPKILAFFEDGPRGGETIAVDAEPDGAAPQEIEFPDPKPAPEPFEESSLRHSAPVVVSTYRLVRGDPRERGGFVYQLVRS